MPFSRINFIKADIPFQPDRPGGAPMFRRRFTVTGPITSAVVHVCGLGYARYFLNGAPMTDDRFIAPVSDYRKTLWYTSYDITDQLMPGENVFAVLCGNGWYNEYMPSSWSHNRAPWRDDPKFILALEVNGERILFTDEHWKCSPTSAVVFNQLRSGEYFDARLYDEAWTALSYDDSAWGNAVSDCTPPTGVFRPCLCEPVREDCVYHARTMTPMGRDRYIFDFGQNLSGYICLTVDQPAGDEIHIRYAEELDEKDEPDLNDMERHYPETPFQTDRFICRGGKFTWSPQFVYHGFRYAEITGLKNPTLASASAVFVHQAVEKRSAFACSDPYLNELFRIGQMATLSNLFYMPTDCPTREKLGWCNDAQASAEQMLTNFTTERLLGKWLQDIRDAMLPDGQLPGIVPTPGWGYHWGNGPVSDGILFEIPYRLYLHTGDTQPLTETLPYFDRYLAFLESRTNADGDITFGLDDWAAPNGRDKVGAAFINSVYVVKFLRIAALAASFAGADPAVYEEKLARQIALHKKKYIAEDGTCTIGKQTAAAMLLYHEIYDDPAPLAAQLARLVEEKNFHHDCGMVGMRHLYIALNQCGLQEYAFRILTAEGFPGCRNWIEDGATTLYEMWGMDQSKNHHMYSDFMSWMMKTIIGIRAETPAYGTVAVEPYFFDALDWAKGHIDTSRGRLAVSWTRAADGVHLELTVPAGITARFGGRDWGEGRHIFVL